MLAIEWTRGIEQAWADLARFVPKLVAALLILVVGFIIAGFIRNLILKGLHAVKFDAMMDRSGIGAPLARAGFSDSAALLAKLLYYAVMLIVLQLAISAFGNQTIKDTFDGLIAFIPRVFIALLIVVITGVVANAVRSLLAPEASEVKSAKLLGRVAFYAIWVIGGFAALDQLGFAQNVVDTLFRTVSYSLGLILVLKFGVGGIWAARDRFWPKVYDAVASETSDLGSDKS